MKWCFNEARWLEGTVGIERNLPANDSATSTVLTLEHDLRSIDKKFPRETVLRNDDGRHPLPLPGGTSGARIPDSFDR